MMRRPRSGSENAELSSLSSDGEGQAAAELIAQHKFDSSDKRKADEVASNGIPLFHYISSHIHSCCYQNPRAQSLLL